MHYHAMNYLDHKQDYFSLPPAPKHGALRNLLDMAVICSAYACLGMGALGAYCLTLS
jgi:hypothetical protein